MKFRCASFWIGKKKEKWKMEDGSEAWFMIHNSWFIMHHALCIMHHASCIMHHASCCHALCIMHHASWIEHHGLSIMHHASCILRAEVTKFRCSGDAERVSENLESQSYEIPMFRRCGEGLGKSSEPKLRNSHVPAMRRGYPKFLRPRKY